MKEFYRIYAIDGLRGLCALVIVAFHSLQFIDISGVSNVSTLPLTTQYGFQILITQILLLIFNGSGAVYLFFVISGLVASLSIDRHGLNLRNIFALFIKRYFRLIPIYYLSLLIMYIFMHLFHLSIRLELVSTFFSSFLKMKDPNIALILNLLLFSTSLNPFAWAVVVEIFATIFFPLMFIIRKQKVIFIGIVYLGLLLLSFFNTTSSINNLFMFFLGFCIPELKDLFVWINGKKQLYNMVFIIAVFILLFCKAISSLSWSVTDVLQGFSAFVIIGLLAFNQTSIITHLLLSKLLQFYGRISYSFYIFQFMILYLFVTLITKFFVVNQNYALTVNILLALLSTVVITLIAYFISKYIEYPFINLAKLLVDEKHT